MITEDYVSDETFKLLKEKGFDDSCCRFVIESDETYYRGAPTLQMAMKWLREVHNIAINIGWGEILEDKFQWWCIILRKDGSVLRESKYYATYEKACEAAIKYCLKNLI